MTMDPPSTPPPPPPPPPMGDPTGPAGSGDVGPMGRPLAGQWQRVIARFLDGVIIGALFGLIVSSVVIGGDDSTGVAGFGADAGFAKVYSVGLLVAAAGFLWDAVCTKIYGGSPMKLAFGMRVVQAETGDPVEWKHAITRWAIPGALALVPIPVLPGFLNLIIVIISLVFLFSKPLRQTVWDQVAGTVVVTK